MENTDRARLLAALNRFLSELDDVARAAEELERELDPVPPAPVVVTEPRTAAPARLPSKEEVMEELLRISSYYEHLEALHRSGETSHEEHSRLSQNLDAVAEHVARVQEIFAKANQAQPQTKEGQ